MINAAMITELFYTDAHRYRALMMILQSHKTQIMISEMPSLCHIPCASKTYQILSPLPFQQSLFFLIQRFLNYNYRHTKEPNWHASVLYINRTDKAHKLLCLRPP